MLLRLLGAACSTGSFLEHQEGSDAWSACALAIKSRFSAVQSPDRKGGSADVCQGGGGDQKEPEPQGQVPHRTLCLRDCQPVSCTTWRG